MVSGMAKYDIHFQPVPADQVYGYKCFEFGFAAPYKVRGLRALVNRWVKTFMTPRGSNFSRPNEGTSFPNLVGANYSLHESSVRDSVIIAVEEANSQVMEQDLVNYPPADERLLNAELLNFIEAPAGIEIWVRITNVAGDHLEGPLVTI